MATCSRVTQHVSEIKQHLKLFSWTQQGFQKYQSLKMSQSIKAPQSALTLLLSYHHGPKSHINCGSYFLPVDTLTDHFMKYTLQWGWTCCYLSSRCLSVVYNHYSHSDLWLLTSNMVFSSTQLQLKISQLRRFGHLVRMPTGRVFGEVFWAYPVRRRPWGRPRTCWRDCLSVGCIHYIQPVSQQQPCHSSKSSSPCLHAQMHPFVCCHVVGWTVKYHI